LRKVCLSFPEAHEVESWGAPTFRLNNHLFAMYAQANNHHGEGREGVWVKCTAINQSLMIAANPRKFFSPPYVGPSGWIGVYLDGRVNWKELTGILRDGYDMTAQMKGWSKKQRGDKPAARKSVKKKAAEKKPARPKRRSNRV
jgi:predicted DNA-binding protein (MmcQ/YjbR family)